MEKIEIKSYFTLGIFTAIARDFAEKKEAQGGKEIPIEDRNDLLRQLEVMNATMQKVSMRHCMEQVHSIKYGLENNQLNWSHLHARFDALRTCSYSEMTDIFVGYIPAERARYWDQKKFYGDRVYDNFVSARQDIISAANCHAVGEYTACVFHSMRVVEKGLRALAKERGLKKLRKVSIEWNDWNTIIKAIQVKVDAIEKDWGRGFRKDSALEFYRGAIGELFAFKDCYRNYVTHDRATYDHGQSISVIHRVMEFMQRLSARLSENQKGAIVWAKK